MYIRVRSLVSFQHMYLECLLAHVTQRDLLEHILLFCNLSTRPGGTIGFSTALQLHYCLHRY